MQRSHPFSKYSITYSVCIGMIDVTLEHLTNIYMYYHTQCILVYLHEHQEYTVYGLGIGISSMFKIFIFTKGYRVYPIALNCLNIINQ